MMTVITRNLGLTKDERILEDMRFFTSSRNNQTPDELWLVQHSPVFTLGSSGKLEHLLEAKDIPIVHSDRGGQITYHGPGQCIVYCMIDIRRIRLGVRALVDLIESTIISLLLQYGISATRNMQAPGVYVAGEKIASLGLRIRGGCSYHGVALNVDMDLSPFQNINPCGYIDLGITSMAILKPSVNVRKVGFEMLEALSNSLKFIYKDMNNTFRTESSS